MVIRKKPVAPGNAFKIAVNKENENQPAEVEEQQPVNGIFKNENEIVPKFLQSLTYSKIRVNFL